MSTCIIRRAASSLFTVVPYHLTSSKPTGRPPKTAFPTTDAVTRQRGTLSTWSPDEQVVCRFVESYFILSPLPPLIFPRSSTWRCPTETGRECRRSAWRRRSIDRESVVPGELEPTDEERRSCCCKAAVRHHPRRGHIMRLNRWLTALRVALATLMLANVVHTSKKVSVTDYGLGLSFSVYVTPVVLTLCRKVKIYKLKFES